MPLAVCFLPANAGVPFAFAWPTEWAVLPHMALAGKNIQNVYSTYISAFILREATARMASAAVSNLARRYKEISPGRRSAPGTGRMRTRFSPLWFPLSFPGFPKDGMAAIATSAEPATCKNLLRLISFISRDIFRNPRCCTRFILLIFYYSVQRLRLA